MHIACKYDQCMTIILQLGLHGTHARTLVLHQFTSFMCVFTTYYLLRSVVASCLCFRRNIAAIHDGCKSLWSNVKEFTNFSFRQEWTNIIERQNLIYTKFSFLYQLDSYYIYNKEMC